MMGKLLDRVPRRLERDKHPKLEEHVSCSHPVVLVFKVLAADNVHVSVLTVGSNPAPGGHSTVLQCKVGS